VHTARSVGRPEEGALGPYLRAIRFHGLVVLLVTLAALAGAIAWLTQREDRYEATAEVLVTPLPDSDNAFVGLQMLRESSDPTRTVQTAANLIDSRQAAAVAARRLGAGYTPGEVQADTEVEAQGQSNILAITATASDARAAAGLANEYARAALDVRRRNVTRQVEAGLRQLGARREAADDPVERAQLAQSLNQLEALRAAGDPTLSLAQPAAVPGSVVGAPAWLVIAVALAAGFILGCAAAMLIELLDRRVRDEEEVVERYPLPVLARVPPLPRSLRRSEVVSPLSMPPAVREAFRAVQVQIERTEGARVVMVTSGSTGDGKTTASVNLAFALARAGCKVILLDLDLRKRDISRHLSVEGAPGLVAMLSGQRRLADLLVPAPELPGLHVVPAGAGNMVLFEALVRKLPEILAQARTLADYVILDTAPLGEVSDALPMTADVDEIVLVARPGHTNRASFDRVHELLERHGTTPLGLLIVGQAPLGGVSYRPYEFEDDAGAVDAGDARGAPALRAP
jgi:capsular exopolysaccharide synthesis family protein